MFARSPVYSNMVEKWVKWFLLWLVDSEWIESMISVKTIYIKEKYQSMK